MKTLDHFSIPYRGMKNGMHTFRFQVDNEFFKCFENSLIDVGNINVELDLDRRSDLAIADFRCKGTVLVTCDRCLLGFDLPIETEFTLHIKEGDADPDEDEIIYINEYTSNLNVAQYIYEWITLSLPMVRMHEDINSCDPQVINKLNVVSDKSEDDNIWSNLKNMNFEN
jgi:uncharacterized metal-binding protein YceD (DUF177 family)